MELHVVPETLINDLFWRGSLVVPKLDRLARSVPDARQIVDQLAAKGVKLALGRNVYDPTDPMGKMFFNPSCNSRNQSRPTSGGHLDR